MLVNTLFENFHIALYLEYIDEFVNFIKQIECLNHLNFLMNAKTYFTNLTKTNTLKRALAARNGHLELLKWAKSLD